VTSSIKDHVIEPQIRYETQYACPDCGHLKTVGDLKDGSAFGPWYCDGCGQGFMGVFAYQGRVMLRRHTDRLVKTLVLLELYKTLEGGERVFLVVEGMLFHKEGEKLEIRDQSYFYNQHTCPTNFMGVEALIAFDHRGGDDDPHGMWQWRETIVKPKDYDSCDVHNLGFDAGWGSMFAYLKGIERPMINVTRTE